MMLKTYLRHSSAQLQRMEVHLKPVVELLYFRENILQQIKPHLQWTTKFSSYSSTIPHLRTTGLSMNQKQCRTCRRTISLMRLWRVGGDCRPRRVASLRCFSTIIPSMSSSRAISVRSGVIGMDRVARRTLVDILQHKQRGVLPFYLY